ncbi:MAG: phage virion morphogenesis protein [Desulfobacterium sp.]|nr:phage virion morphogenesis protein [Desulfobacterium sp.]
MASAGVAFEIHDQDFKDLINRVGHSIKDMTPVMEAFAEYMVVQTDDRFKNEEAPDGSGWEKLATITLASKARRKKMDKILQQDGYLRLVHPASDKDSAGVYSDRVYSAIHNYGGQAGPNRSVTIPKREFLGFNEDDIKEFQETGKDWIIMGERP